MTDGGHEPLELAVSPGLLAGLCAPRPHDLVNGVDLGLGFVVLFGFQTLPYGEVVGRVDGDELAYVAPAAILVTSHRLTGIVDDVEYARKLGHRVVQYNHILMYL